MRFEWIPIEKLWIDEEHYQRVRKPRKVENIVKRGFDMRKALALGVMDRGDGTYAVWEGGHRLEAAQKAGNVKMLPCMVSSKGSVADEANLFVDTNHFRANVNHVDIFKALVTVGDAGALEIKRIAEKHGFRIGAGSAENMIQNTRILARIWDRYGADILDQTLGFLRIVWNGDEISLNGIFIEGTATLLARVNPDTEQLQTLIAKMSPRSTIETKRRVRDYQLQYNVDPATGVAAVLAKTYNDRLPKGQKRISMNLFTRSAASSFAMVNRKIRKQQEASGEKPSSMFIGIFAEDTGQGKSARNRLKTA